MPLNPFARKGDELVQAFRRLATRNGIEVLNIDDDLANVRIRGEPSNVNLRNIRRTYQTVEPKERDAALAAFVEGILRTSSNAPEQTLEQVRERLVPRIGPIDWIPESESRRILIPDSIQVNVAVDEGGAIWYVTRKHLERWGVTLDDLCAVAIANMGRMSPPGAWKSFPNVPGVLFYDVKDGNGASRILVLKTLLSPWPSGGVIAAVPMRDLLMCVRFDSLENLKSTQHLMALARQMHSKEGYPISAALFWSDGETLERLPMRRAGNAMEVVPPPRFRAVLEAMKANSPTPGNVSVQVRDATAAARDLMQEYISLEGWRIWLPTDWKHEVYREEGKATTLFYGPDALGSLRVSLMRLRADAPPNAIKDILERQTAKFPGSSLVRIGGKDAARFEVHGEEQGTALHMNGWLLGDDSAILTITFTLPVTQKESSKAKSELGAVERMLETIDVRS